MRRALLSAVAVGAVALGLAACSGYQELEPDPGASPAPGAVVADSLTDGTLTDGAIPGTDAASYAVATSETFFAAAALVVLAADDDADQVRAASLATTLGVPALVSTGGEDAALVAELERLDTRTVLVVGDAPVPEMPEHRPMLRAVPAPLDLVALQVVIGHDLEREVPTGPDAAIRALANGDGSTGSLVTLAPEAEPIPTPDPGDLAQLPGLPSYEVTARTTGALVVTGNDLEVAPAVGTARAAGAEVLVLTGDEAPTIAQGAGKTAGTVLSLGPAAAALGSPADVAYLARIAVAGVPLPGGGLTLLPGKEYLALRGLPGAAELGPVGAGVGTAVARLRADGSGLPGLVPTLELVATVATAEPGPSGTYSAAQPLEVLRAAVADASAEDAMVLLSFQPGREPFEQQLRAYSELLREPGVGVLLEPQWRLADDETPDSHSGAVGDGEVVDVATWVADFVRENSLPPKIVAVRDPLGPSAFTVSRPEIALVVVANGAAVAPEIPTPEGANPAEVPPVPAVTAEQVWSETVVSGPAWWGWDQGSNPVPLAELLALDPRPVLIRLN